MNQKELDDLNERIERAEDILRQFEESRDNKVADLFGLTNTIVLQRDRVATLKSFLP